MCSRIYMYISGTCMCTQACTRVYMYKHIENPCYLTFTIWTLIVISCKKITKNGLTCSLSKFITWIQIKLTRNLLTLSREDSSVAPESWQGDIETTAGSVSLFPTGAQTRYALSLISPLPLAVCTRNTTSDRFCDAPRGSAGPGPIQMLFLLSNSLLYCFLLQYIFPVAVFATVQSPCVPHINVPINEFIKNLIIR